MNLLLSNLQSLMGLTGISLLLSATIFRVLLFFKVKKSFAAIIAIILFALSYLSISGYSINFYVRGLFNDLSISSLVLLSYYLISSVNKTLSHNNPAYPAFSLIALTGLFFYPAALGLGMIDPYSWGFINKTHDHYSSLIFITCLAGLMTFSLIKQYNLLLLCLVLSTLAYQLKLLESQNLWDYLLDPLIFIYALIMVISRISKKMVIFQRT